MRWGQRSGFWVLDPIFRCLYFILWSGIKHYIRNWTLETCRFSCWSWSDTCQSWLGVQLGLTVFGDQQVYSVDSTLKDFVRNTQPLPETVTLQFFFLFFSDLLRNRGLGCRSPASCWGCSFSHAVFRLTLSEATLDYKYTNWGSAGRAASGFIYWTRVRLSCWLHVRQCFLPEGSFFSEQPWQASGEILPVWEWPELCHWYVSVLL